MRIPTSRHAKLAAVLLSMPVAILTGCVKGNSNANSNTTATITATIEAQNSLGLTRTMLVNTKLDATFGSNGPYTVFVASDNSYNSVNITSSYLGTLSDSTQTSYILYGALASNTLSANLPAGPNAKMFTMSGDSIFVTNGLSGKYINGIELAQTDVLCSNGVLNVLSGVLLPPTGNFMQKIGQADTSVSLTTAAIARASTGKTNISDLLTNHGPYTFFLPDNDAWRGAGVSSTTAINVMNPDSLGNILLYHIVAGRLFSSDMLSGATPTGLNLESFTISSPTITGNTIYGTHNTTRGNIIYSNIMVRNGVLHLINVLLKP